MAALSALPLGAAGAAGAEASGAAAPPAAAAGRRTLVAYFTRSGNTRVIAKLLQRTLSADLFEIRPVQPYPEDYFENVEQARLERDRDGQRALLENVAEMAQYHTVYLGFPIWGETMPPVIKAFLAGHDLAGKTLIPFITHGGYGAGNSAAELARRAPKARLQPAFVMEADQERRTTTEVQDWLKTRPAAPARSGA
jgi:flavodoxin